MSEKRTNTPTLPAGKKVKLGDGREGVVVRKEECDGFYGYIVKITSSPDKSQIGQTVGATVPGLRSAQLDPAKPQNVVQPTQPVQMGDPQQEKDQEKRVKQEEVGLLSRQVQNINDRIKLLQQVAQTITPLTKNPQQDQFDNLNRLEQADEQKVQEEKMEDTQQQMMQQNQDQFKQQQTVMQQQQMMKQSWVHPEHADVEVKLGDRVVLCDVAATPKQQASGLQTYDNLPRDRGLWFPMYSRRVASFHMGDVQFPIDIVFVDHSRVIKVVAGVSPRQPGSWSSQCTDVIEVTGGWCAENGISVGSQASTPLTSKRSRIEIERILNKSAAAHNSYDPVRGITEAEAVDPLEQEVFALFPHLKKKAQELYKPSTDRKPTIDKRNPLERFKDHDTPDVSSPEGQDNPNLGAGGDVSQQSSYGKNYHEQQGYDPATFREEDHPYALRPSAQRVQINSPSPDTELAGVIPEKLAQSSTQLYAQYKPTWNEMEDDSRGYQKMAVVDDELISRWIDSLGFDPKNEAKLRQTMFTDAYKNLLGSALVAAGEASNFELFDSDLILYV